MYDNTTFNLKKTNNQFKDFKSHVIKITSCKYLKNLVKNY